MLKIINLSNASTNIIKCKPDFFHFFYQKAFKKLFPTSQLYERDFSGFWPEPLCVNTRIWRRSAESQGSLPINWFSAVKNERRMTKITKSNIFSDRQTVVSKIKFSKNSKMPSLNHWSCSLCKKDVLEWSKTLQEWFETTIGN